MDRNCSNGLESVSMVPHSGKKACDLHFACEIKVPEHQEYHLPIRNDNFEAKYPK